MLWGRKIAARAKAANQRPLRRCLPALLIALLMNHSPGPSRLTSRSTAPSPASKPRASLAEQPRIAEDFSKLASPDGQTGLTILPLRFRGERVVRIVDVAQLDVGIHNLTVCAWGSLLYGGKPSIVPPQK